ncbi:RidA family protein [Variovorax sp.]|jgi:2-iminobutanoate/2-iminopropanoate deaminase|uniref:RidA family protein n=1 Tax=unclassified Variovorax TaxID=663243 RepID=UPI0012246ACC|nr:RidA family protein [Variovorax sp.]TAJ64717.1 MAG: RidA family protein [Variovorax sp.]
MTLTANQLPFSKLRSTNGLLFLSGELPIPDAGPIPEDIALQTDLTLHRIDASLRGVGLSLASVVQVTVHLARAEDFAAFNAAYRKHFQSPYPTRTTVVAQLLLPGARIEITVIAAMEPATEATSDAR